MRLHFASLAFLYSSLVVTGQTAAPTCADLHIVPAVRECRNMDSLPIGVSGVVIPHQENPETEFVVSDLGDALKERGVAIDRHDPPSILLFRADSKGGEAVLAEHHLEFDSAMREEGYVIAPAGVRTLAVIAKTPTGFFYGAQTVKQLIRGSGKDTVLLVPTIRDWPAMAHRGLSDDWSRGPLPNMEFVKREIRTLAAYKYNIFSPYFEHTFAYSSTPVAAFPGGAMTPDEAREMVAYAAKYHITIIPEQEAFGHLHHVLKFEQYSPLGETPHGHVLAPGDPNTLPQIGKLVWRTGPGVSRTLRAHRRRRNRRTRPGPHARPSQAAGPRQGLSRLPFADSHDARAQSQASALLGRHRRQLAGTRRHAAQGHDRRALGVRRPARLHQGRSSPSPRPASRRGSRPA